MPRKLRASFAAASMPADASQLKQLFPPDPATTRLLKLAV